MKRLNPRKLETQALTIVFDPRVGSSLLGHLVGAITGGVRSRASRASCSISLGKQVFAPGIDVMDDPHRIRGLRSRPFDGEGLATTPTPIIRDGVLTQWLLDSSAARQLGLAPTGHAARGTSGAPGAGPANLHLAAGTQTPAELLNGIKRGLYVTELIGMGVNGLTGDYSRGASGFLIEDGEIGEPVAEVTIAGNLRDMFLNLAVANDLEFRHATNVPTIRIEGMTLAGA